MDGQALIQLYKMCLSRSSKFYALLNDELKSAYKMKLPIGIYTRFIGAMEQSVTTHPLASLQTKPVLPPTTTTTTVTKFTQNYVPPILKQSRVNNVAHPYPLYSGEPYDLLLTSDASAVEIFAALSRCGPNAEKISTFLKRYSGRF
jgi:hypothetical protein